MADESTTTQAILRALLKEMEKSLTQTKPKEIDLDNYKTRVNVKEFERGQREGNSWDEDDGSGGDEPFGLDLRPTPKPKSRSKRRPR